MARANWGKFMVADRPFVVWEWDLKGRNIEFLKSVDPAYFDHVAKINQPALLGEDRHYAALSIRTAYSHALESFLALLFGVLQAPYTTYGWLLQYQLGDLRNLVESLRRHRPIKSPYKTPLATWRDVAEAVLGRWSLGDATTTEAIVDGFTGLWTRFAADFTDETATDEYNSIKHGLRTGSGGFYLSVGAEDVPGTPAPPERMQSLGGSEFGSTFFRVERLAGTKNNFRGRRVSRNWDPENLVRGLEMISLSIHNIIAFALAQHGVTEDLFAKVPQDPDAYWGPWSKSIGVTSSTFEQILGDDHISALSASDIGAAFEPVPDS